MGDKVNGRRWNGQGRRDSCLEVGASEKGKQRWRDMEQGPAVRAGNCSGMKLTAGCLRKVKEFRLIKVGKQRKFY